ncbi:MAG: NAD(P)-binding domain-containing protein, partial [Candidatus Binatia bacterium]
MGQQFGVVGLAVMGRNLALNVERNGFPIAVFNRNPAPTDEFLNGPARGKNVVGAREISEFVGALDPPRRILLMVKAGPAVDSMIQQLRPLVASGDIIIDGGNSHYVDTDRRVAALEPSGVRFFGMGVSGGEEGALWGPSLMPGGDKPTYNHLEPVFTRIAAKTDSGPCVTYIGSGSSGHFVKMVHNGIEYGDMQLIAESYDLLRHALRLEPPVLAQIFAEWNRGPLSSFLIEITARIFQKKDAETGKWMSQIALDLGVAIPTVNAAVEARILSARKSDRVQASRSLPG